MRTHVRLAHAAAILLVGTSAAAQEATSCAASPGGGFGVVGYQCANCGFSRQGQRLLVSFMAEPVVTETSTGSKIIAGDVIEAVNGKPITTRAGGDAFASPPVGDNTVTVRRGRDHETLRISVAEPPMICEFAVRRGTRAGAGASAGSGTAAGVGEPDRRIQFQGVIRVDARAPLYVVDGVVMDGAAATARQMENATTSRFGFAVACEPSCTPATDVDGPLMYTYYKYDAPPPIVAVRSGSAAEAAGLKVGDRLVKIGGHSIADAEGALALARIDKVQTVRLTIRRDGKDLDYVVTVPR